MRIAGLMILISTGLFAQQQMTLQDAEDAFRKNNLQLIAQAYNINQAEADVIQAKIWDLPVGSFSANLAEPSKPSFFNIGPTKSLQVSQLFLLGGKRQKQVDFAKTNIELAQLQFKQLTVDLRTQLRENFYAIYFDKRKVQSIDNQLGYLTDLLKAYKVQVKKGNISLKDEVRLNSMIIGLNNDKIQLKNNMVAEENVLMTITGITEPIVPVLNASEVAGLLKSEPLASLEELKTNAEQNNADYQYSLKEIESSQKYLAWQKSLNTPDLTGGLQWNQNSGYYKNEVNFSVGIPIPLWKQNAGNIKKAEYLTQQNQQNAEYKKLNLHSQVTSAYNTWKNNYEQLKAIPQQDIDNLDTVYKGMTDNFRRGNVTLIEFTDFTESYKQAVMQINEIKKQVLISAEELNHLTQTPVF